MQIMTGLERPLLGVAAGTIATIAIQSSSAMLGIVITLAGQGLLTLPAGLAIMLGAEIGTCADTLVASIGRTRAAVRAGIFHLGFNVICAAAGVLLIEQLAALSRALPGGDSLLRQIANAHVAFNVLGVAALPAVHRDDRTAAGTAAARQTCGSNMVTRLTRLDGCAIASRACYPQAVEPPSMNTSANATLATVPTRVAALNCSRIGGIAARTDTRGLLRPWLAPRAGPCGALRSQRSRAGFRTRNGSGSCRPSVRTQAAKPQLRTSLGRPIFSTSF